MYHVLIYLDSDVLALSDLSELFDLRLLPGKLIAAVPDSETLSLEQDFACCGSGDEASRRRFRYLDSGVTLMDLDALRNTTRFFPTRCRVL